MSSGYTINTGGIYEDKREAFIIVAKLAIGENMIDVVGACLYVFGGIVPESYLINGFAPSISAGIKGVEAFEVFVDDKSYGGIYADALPFNLDTHKLLIDCRRNRLQLKVFATAARDWRLVMDVTSFRRKA